MIDRKRKTQTDSNYTKAKEAILIRACANINYLVDRNHKNGEGINKLNLMFGLFQDSNKGK